MRRKSLIAVVNIIMCLSVLTGCSRMVSNPMAYILEEDAKKSDDEAVDQTEEKTEADTNIDNSMVEITGSEAIPIVETANKDGFSNKDMAELVAEVNTKLAADNVEGIVIVHEKSTIEEISYLLKLTVRSKKPMVFIAITSQEEDITDRVGKAKQYIKGEVEQLDSSLVSVVGYGDEAFDISGVKELAAVDILYDYSGNNASSFKDVLKYDDGVVIVASTADGNLSPGLKDYVTGKNTFPIIISYSGNEATYELESSYNDRYIMYTDKSPVEARILLMLCLSTKLSVGDTRQCFFNY